MTIFIKNLIFPIILFNLIFGYYLENVIGFRYIDEICEFLFLSYLVCSKKSKEITFFFAVFLFYLFYSYFFSANPNHQAQFVDFIQQIKPYAIFYFFYSADWVPNRRQMRVLKWTGVFIVVCFTISYQLYSSDDGLVSHPLTLGVSAFSFACMLYYFERNSTRIHYIAIFTILIMGCLSMRAKYFGEVLTFVFAILFVKEKIKFNFRYFIIGICALFSLYYVTITKFTFYFVDAEGAARAILYANMPIVLMKYIPFGSGFASYATHASGEFYSPLYNDLGISDGYGMSEDNISYISDTYFPVLAQFGFIGILLFGLFWYRRYKDIEFVANYNLISYRVGLLILAMVIIESVAGPVLVMSWDFVPLMILGLICNDVKRKKATMPNSCCR